MLCVRHLLVLCEDSPEGDRALFTAAGLAEQLGSQLTVVAAADVNMPGRKRCCGSGGMCLNDFEREEADRRLRRAAVLLTDRPDTQFVPALGTPARALVTTAAERGCDLIVVPAPARHRIPLFTGGHKHRELRRLATVPVLETPASGGALNPGFAPADKPSRPLS